VTSAWDRIGPIVAQAVKLRCHTGTNTRILAADSDAHPRLRGTIALVLQKHFGVPTIA